MKMKKKFVVILVLTMIMGMSMQVNRCFASEGSNDVPVTYTPTEDSVLKFNMNVIIKGDGYLLDGEQKLIGDSTVYVLKKGSLKVFKVIPSSGSYVKSIVFDGVDITRELENDVLSVNTKAHNTQLVITFANNVVNDTPQEEPKEPNQNTNRVPDRVVTGDSTSLKMITGILITSGIILLMITKKKKEEKESENGGN